MTEIPEHLRKRAEAAKAKAQAAAGGDTPAGDAPSADSPAGTAPAGDEKIPQPSPGPRYRRSRHAGDPGRGTGSAGRW